MVIVSIMEKIDDFDWSAISKKSIKKWLFYKNGTKNCRVSWQDSFRSLEFFFIMKISFFSLAVWCVDCSSTWDCFKQNSAEHYQCKHVARKISSYVKQIAAPRVHLLPDSLINNVISRDPCCFRFNTFTRHFLMV